jgi:hypothetical protein
MEKTNIISIVIKFSNLLHFQIPQLKLKLHNKKYYSLICLLYYGDSG